MADRTMKGRTMMAGLSILLALAGCGGGADGSSITATNNAITPVAPAAAASPAATKPSAVPSLSAPSLTAPAPSSPAETLDSFWARFRKVALARDVNGIAALSAPIVTQYGLLDDSPKYRLPAAKAAAVLVKFLDDPNVTDGNNRTNRQQLEATPKVALDREWSTDRLRVGDMEFEHGPKGWRLVSFYYEP